jgi:hypothetical protein
VNDLYRLYTVKSPFARHQLLGKSGVKASAKRSDGQNTLWKYFGLKSTSKPYEGKGEVETKLDMLALQFESLNRKFEGRTLPKAIADEYDSRDPLPTRLAEAHGFVHKYLHHELGLTQSELSHRGGRTLEVLLPKDVPPTPLRRMRSLVWDRYGIKVLFHTKPTAEDSEGLDEWSGPQPCSVP